MEEENPTGDIETAEEQLDADDSADAEPDGSVNAEIVPQQPSCGCGTGPEETDEQWDERTKDSPRFFLYALVGILIVIGLIVGIKHFYNPIPPTPTGSVVSTYEPHPSSETRVKYTYNGWKFNKEEDMWHTLVQRGNTVYDIEFYYGPAELEEVPLSGEFTEVFQQDPIYVTFDPREEGNLKYLALSIGQFDTSLIRSFDKKIIPGCLVNKTDACAAVPVINCDNTKEKAVFYFKIADEPGVIIEENCVTIQGKDWGLMKATEKFLMKAYGVI